MLDALEHAARKVTGCPVSVIRLLQRAGLLNEDRTRLLLLAPFRVQRAQLRDRPSRRWPRYWAVRAAYPTITFEGKWLVDAAKQEQTLLVRVPAGAKTYTKSAQSPLTLDPNQLI